LAKSDVIGERKQFVVDVLGINSSFMVWEIIFVILPLLQIIHTKLPWK